MIDTPDTMHGRYPTADDEEEVEPDPDLADSIIFRSSPHHRYLGGGAYRVAVAQKGGVDVCWNCHRPVLVPDQYVDVPMKEAMIRLCSNGACIDSASSELVDPGRKIVSLPTKGH